MKTIPCRVFGHDYVVTRHVTSYVKEYTCKHCKKQLTTSGNGNLIELTPKYKEINDALEHFYLQRLSRTSKQSENLPKTELKPKKESELITT